MFEELTQDQKDYVEYLMSDKKAFDAFVYTPWREALQELDIRQNDATIDAYLAQTLPQGVPEIMRGKKSMVLGRHVATPNFETQRFLSCADVLRDLQPIIFEHTEDRFTDINESKLGLGRMPFYKGFNSVNQKIFEYEYVINMNQSNGKKISSVVTTWNEPLVEFHHRFFNTLFPNYRDVPFNGSSWLLQAGKGAAQYYMAYMSLFIKHGVLFENLLTTKHETAFTSEVILPTILNITSITGKKPLIIEMGPIGKENDLLWLSYPYAIKSFVDNNAVSSHVV